MKCNKPPTYEETFSEVLKVINTFIFKNNNLLSPKQDYKNKFTPINIIMNYRITSDYKKILKTIQRQKLCCSQNATKLLEKETKCNVLNCFS